MDVHNVLRTENLAGEAGDAVLPEPDDGQHLGLCEPGDLLRHRHWLHMDDICRADHVADATTRALFKLDTFDHVIS
jgi:hypothetical protein